MSLPGYVTGMPGVRDRKTASHRVVFLQGDEGYLAQGRVIDGGQSRDPGNTDDVGVLRAGLLMGKITTSGKYAPSFIGVTTLAYTSGGTTLTVSAAAALELSRLLGASGTAEMVAVGPPTAAGTVAVTDITHSAINTTTGAITVTSLGVDKVAGTFIGVKDGRQLPLTFIPDGWGILVFDSDGTTAIDQPFPKVPVCGMVDSSQLLPAWPGDTSIQTWIKDQLKTFGVFSFDHGY